MYPSSIVITLFPMVRLVARGMEQYRQIGIIRGPSHESKYGQSNASNEELLIGNMQRLI